MPNNDPITRAAHLAALLPLWESGQLEGMTLQEIADLVEVGHRSTAMRYLRALPKVAEERDRLARQIRSRGPKLIEPQ